MSELARRIANLPPERLALLLDRLGKSEPRGAIARRPAAERCPLSVAQERFWLLERLHPGSGANHTFRALRLSGALDAPALARALDAVVARHEVLRATFHEEELGTPYQRFTGGALPRLATISLAALPPARREAVVLALAVAAARQPFSLARGPLLRAWLVVLGADDHALLLAVHHIVSDGWSNGILLRDLAAAYAAAGAPALPELPVQYGDFAVWQRRELGGERLAELLAFWRERLAGLGGLELPTDRPRGPRASAAGASVPITLAPAVVERLEGLSRAAGATLFATLCSLLYVQLARYSGHDDLTLGTPVAGRNVVEVEDLVGCFINTVVLRLAAGEELTFSQLVAAVSAEVVGALAHQELPFAKLVHDLSPDRSLQETPLFQVMIVLQSAPVAAPALGGVRSGPLAAEPGLVALDLQLEFAPTADGLRGHLEFRTDLFDRATIRRWAAHLETLAAAAAADPGRPVRELPLLPAAERAQLAWEWNDTAREQSAFQPIHAEIAARAAAVPAATALVCAERHLSYGELARRAAVLAARLCALGVGPEVRVAVALPRSLELVIGTLAVLHAGGAYVPLDPGYPAERLAFMLADAGAPVLLAERGFAAGGAAAVVHLDGAAGPPPAPPAAVDGAGLIYVIYTSGSTGRPKGAMNAHAAVRNRLHWMQDAYVLGPADRVLQKTPFSFDVSVWELFWPLLTGACMVLARPGGHQDPAYLADLIQREGVTTLHFVPSMLEVFLDHPAVPACSSLRRVVCSGEALPQALAERFAALLGADLQNLYGPTEAAVDVTAAAAGSAAGRAAGVSIGRPIANLTIHLLDRAQRPVPIGVPGELYIGGAGLGRGYLERPGLTAERFVPDGAGAGDRLYRSGDLARFLADGRIQYLGRTDRQVKLRGFRIELQEIEAALRDCPAVGEAAVVGRREPGGELQIVAYVVTRDGAPLPVAEIAELLARRLPPYMVPAAWVQLARLPLSPNGKLDPRALPPPEEAPAAPRQAAATRTPTEEILGGFWMELLHRRDVGPGDDFFALGGHSLLASQLVARIRRACGVEVPLAQVFAAPILAQLAAAVDALRPAAGAATPAVPPLERAPRGGALAASFAQQRFWFLQQMEPASGIYNLALTLRVDGDLAVATVRRSLSELLRRHEVLRTTIESVDGEPRQRVHPPAPVPVPTIDLSALGDARVQADLAHALACGEADRPFDLATDLPLRACLLRLRPDCHWGLLTVHHVATDGWSMDILFEEVAVLFDAFARGEPSPLPELPLQYADYAVWQRAWLDDTVLAAEVAFWRQQLAGMPQALELPLDRPRPPRPTLRGGRRRIDLPLAVGAGVAALARREGVTLFMVLLAAFELALARSSGQTDFGVGALVAGRTQAETEGLIGALVNSLVLRARLAGEPSGHQLLRRVREVSLAAFSHQYLPFERLVEELQPVRDPSRTPLFQVVLLLQNFRATAVTLPGLAFQAVTLDRHFSAFDLSLAVEQQGEALGGALEYSAELFDGATAERLRGHFATLLAGLVAATGAPALDLPLLTAPELQQVVHEWVVAEVAPASRGFLALFAARAAAAADAIAIAAPGEQLSYGALERGSAALARALARARAGVDGAVGVWMAGGIETFAALLGVLRAGAAFLPLDPGYPRARLAWQLEAAACRVVVARGLPAELALPGVAVLAPLAADNPTDAADAPDATDAAPAADLPAPPAAAAAYILFTSGSTGLPKGAVVPHGALGGFTEAMARRLALAPGDRVLQFAAPGFDVLIEELFPAWAAGACVVLGGAAMQSSPAALTAVLAAHQVTVAELPTAYWHEWVHELAAAAAVAGGRCGPPPALRCLLIGGELAAAEELAAWQRFGVPLWNVYGLTETTVSSAVQELDATFPAPIGRPLENTRLYVLDRWGNRVPVGVAGELFIGGTGLARGYLARPGTTAERFVPDAFAVEPGARLYRTGDLVRFQPDGALVFLGRVDTQVKLRGFRIELGEIEAALRQAPGVGAAAVVVRETAAGERQLLACVCPAPGWSAVERLPAAGAAPAPPGALLRCDDGLRGVTVDDLRARLRRTLPDYMVPASFAALPALPATANGKLDRRALAALPAAGPAAAAARPQPPPLRAVLPVHELVAAVWSEVLGLAPAADPAGDFFELGGHSLLAMKLFSRLHGALAVRFPISLVFEAPTLGRLQAAIEEHLRQAQGAVLPRLAPAPRAAPPPASFAQQRLWFLDQADPGSAAYNVAVALALDGPVDLAVLAAALTEIVRRHEVLRTTFAAVDGLPAQVIHPPAPCPLPIVDLAPLPEPRREALATGLIAGERAVGFDLARGPLLRARWLRLGVARGVLLLTAHHTVCDGWSAGIFVRELAALYEAAAAGRASPLPELPAQYADFAVWQRGFLSGEVRERQVRFWQETLLPLPPRLLLPRDLHPAAAGGERELRAGVDAMAESRDLLLPAAVGARLRKRAGERSASLFVLMTAAFEALLASISGQTDFVVGANAANRSLAETEPMIGFFVNQVALRADLGGDPTFEELMARVRTALLGAWAHQDLPFEMVVDAVRPARGPDGAELFAAKIDFDVAPSDLLLPEARARAIPVARRLAHVELLMLIEEVGEQVAVALDYRTDRFLPATIERWLGRFAALLERVAADPAIRLSQLIAGLAAAERETLQTLAGAVAETSRRRLERLRSRTAAAQRGELRS